MSLYCLRYKPNDGFPEPPIQEAQIIAGLEVIGATDVGHGDPDHSVEFRLDDSTFDEEISDRFWMGIETIGRSVSLNIEGSALPPAPEGLLISSPDYSLREFFAFCIAKYSNSPHKGAIAILTYLEDRGLSLLGNGWVEGDEIAEVALQAGQAAAFRLLESDRK